jgi:predicted Zn-dependent protease
VNLFKSMIFTATLTAFFVGTCLAGDSPALVSTEQSLWDMASVMQAEDEQRGAVLRDAGLDAYLQTIVQRLWQQGGSDMLQPVIRVILTPQLLARAYPNGVCDLSSGMLAHLNNEDQLAMILAHEMVHYLQRHTLQAFGHAHMSFSSTSGSRYGDQSRSAAAPAISDFVNAVEQEADRQGLAIMRKAGYCPGEALQLLKSFLADGAHVPVSELQPAAVIRQRIEIVHYLLNETSGAPPCRQSDRAQVTYVNQVAPALLANAQAAVNRGRWKSAHNSILRYIATQPRDARGYFVLGQIHACAHGRDSLSQAMAAYQQAIYLDFGFVDAHYALGVIYLKSGQYQKAHGHFQRCISLAPDGLHNAYIQEYLRLCAK